MTLNSKIILCRNIKLDRNYVNVLNYTEGQMLALCQANAIASKNNYSFIRQTQSIYTDFTYAQALQANYIAFQNPDYSNKWFFAWIDDVIYKGEKNCEITYTIDAWSTWFSQWTAKPCFVNRHHVNDDTIGINTVDENLNIGEVIQESETEDSSYTNEYGFWIAIASAWQPSDNSHTTSSLIKEGTQFNGISVYNKQVFGHKLFLFKITSNNDFLNPRIIYTKNECRWICCRYKRYIYYT